MSSVPTGPAVRDSPPPPSSAPADSNPGTEPAARRPRGVGEDIKSAFLFLERRVFSPETAALLLVAAAIFGFLSAAMVLADVPPESPGQEAGGPVSLAGYVMTKNGTGISHAVVRISSLSMSAVADDRGYYILEDVPPGEYTLTAEASGYGDVSVRITVETGRPGMYDLVLPPSGEHAYYDWRSPEPPPSFRSMNLFLSGVFVLGSVSALGGAFFSWSRSHFKTAMLLSSLGVLSYGFIAGSILAGVAVFLLMGQKHVFPSSSPLSFPSPGGRGVPATAGHRGVGGARPVYHGTGGDTGGGAGAVPAGLSEPFHIHRAEESFRCELCGEAIPGDRAFIECRCGAAYHLQCGLGKRCVRCGQEFKG
ncbi:MAG: carboxypeptidase regulatory-like domain-containing protein [Thermoplasmata archaeon]|nr:carboxypeptidase regulatory-like domain-containing protein [Thermoplasmata archaeon]